jgi:hypothetical protein
MNSTSGPPKLVKLRSPTTARVVAILCAALLTTVSWWGSVDDHAEAYLDEALLAGGAVYATARSINALVSVIQGTEVNPPFLTVSVGEALDPLNDLIERFSAVLLMALGSLAAQKILLTIFSTAGFSIVLALLTLALVICSPLSGSRWFGGTLRVFILLVFTRFSLGVIVLVSGIVDTQFLQEPEAANHAEMRALQDQLSAVRSSATAQAENPDSSLWARGAALMSPSRIGNAIDGLEASAQSAISSTVSLLASMLLKTLLIPLLLFWVVLQAGRATLRKLVA